MLDLLQAESMLLLLHIRPSENACLTFWVFISLCLEIQKFMSHFVCSSCEAKDVQLCQEANYRAPVFIFKM